MDSVNEGKETSPQPIYENEQYQSAFLNADYLAACKDIVRVITHIIKVRRILDCGCGPGPMLRYFANGVREVIGIDISPIAKRAMPDVIQIGDVTVPDEGIDYEFDMVISFGVIDLLPTIDDVYNHFLFMARRTRHDGYIIACPRIENVSQLHDSSVINHIAKEFGKISTSLSTNIFLSSMHSKNVRKYPTKLRDIVVVKRVVGREHNTNSRVVCDLSKTIAQRLFNE